MNRDFLKAFGETIGANEIVADEQWAAYSRQLSDKQREAVERGGAKAGKREGKDFLKLCPNWKANEEE